MLEAPKRGLPVLRRICLVVILTLAACAPRGELAMLDGPAAETHEVFVGTTRGPDRITGAEYGDSRSEKLHLARFKIAVQ